MFSPMKPWDIISILLKNNFELKRQTWSHKVFRKDSKVVVVPFHWSKDIPVPTLKSIIKQSWLDEINFLK